MKQYKNRVTLGQDYLTEYCLSSNLQIDMAFKGATMHQHWSRGCKTVTFQSLRYEKKIRHIGFKAMFNQISSTFSPPIG